MMNRRSPAASAELSRSAPPPAPGRARASGTAVIAILALCGTVVSLQQTVILPLLPEFPRLLDSTVGDASWLVTATLLAGAVSTPLIARLADMFGKKPMIMVTLLIMISGSVLGALSAALPSLIAARALQGAGMALVPVGIAAMRDELPSHRLPLGVALMSSTLALGAGAGLPLAGLIASWLDWHAVFWMTAGLGGFLLIAVAFTLPRPRMRGAGEFDYWGALLLSSAMTALLLALAKGGYWGWTSTPTLGLVTAGLLLLLVWLPVELRVHTPLVNVRTAFKPAVLTVNVAALLSGFAMFTNMLVTAQLFQLPRETGYGLGFDTLSAGLWMVPSTVVFAVMAPVSAWITRRWGSPMTIVAGAVLMTGAYAFRMVLSETLAQIVLGSTLVAIGTALLYAAMPTLIMRLVPQTETASANGMNTLLRTVGTSVASAALAVTASSHVVHVGGAEYPSIEALTALLAVATGTSAGVALAGAALLRLARHAAIRQPVPGQSAPFRLNGLVISPSGRPLPGAIVLLHSFSGERAGTSYSDRDGRFTLTIPRPGTYVAVAARAGSLPAVHIGELEPRHPLTMVLRPLDYTPTSRHHETDCDPARL